MPDWLACWNGSYRAPCTHLVCDVYLHITIWVAPPKKSPSPSPLHRFLRNTSFSDGKAVLSYTVQFNYGPALVDSNCQHPPPSVCHLDSCNGVLTGLTCLHWQGLQCADIRQKSDHGKTYSLQDNTVHSEFPSTQVHHSQQLLWPNVADSI